MSRRQCLPAVTPFPPANVTSFPNLFYSKTKRRILCEDGDWRGRSLECDARGRPKVDSSPSSALDHQGIFGGGGDSPSSPEKRRSRGRFNASCPFPGPLESNIVAFHGDRQVKRRLIQQHLKFYETAAFLKECFLLQTMVETLF